MATSTGGANPQPKENLPEAATGDSRDQAGKALGISGKSVDRAALKIKDGNQCKVAPVERSPCLVAKAVKNQES